MSESQLAAWRTRHVGFVFQFYHLLPVLSAYENVELPLLLLPLTAAQRRQQVLTALDLVGLSDRLHHRPGQLSGGQQQRVGIARAIVTDPTLIVADEPTGDLDSKSAEEILNLLVELQKGLHKTIIMVTHDPRAASRAERVLHLDKGRLVDEVANPGDGAYRAADHDAGPSEMFAGEALGRSLFHGSTESRPDVALRPLRRGGRRGRPLHPGGALFSGGLHLPTRRRRGRGGGAAARRRLPPGDLLLPPLRPQKPVPQPAAHRADRRRHHAAGLRRHARLDRSVVPQSGDDREEQGPQGHRHRALADPQPDAVLLRRRPGRRRRPQARRREAAGLHDLAVLRRHPRPRQADAREHRLLLRHGPEKVPDR